MPVPTTMKISVNDLLVLDVQLDTARGASIPRMTVRGHRDGKRCDVATAVLDSGSGRWDATFPSGAAWRASYPVRDIEGPASDTAYWKAVRRAAESFAVDVLKDAAAAVGVWT